MCVRAVCVNCCMPALYAVSSARYPPVAQAARYNAFVVVCPLPEWNGSPNTVKTTGEIVFHNPYGYLPGDRSAACGAAAAVGGGGVWCACMMCLRALMSVCCAFVGHACVLFT